jgi:hypothetical protein
MKIPSMKSNVRLQATQISGNVKVHVNYYEDWNRNLKHETLILMRCYHEIGHSFFSSLSQSDYAVTAPFKP